MVFQVAFSPCPNDTFVFFAWVNGLLKGASAIEPVLTDIQQLNEWCLQGKYPLSKLSFGCLGRVLDEYVLLPVGAALGWGCGPKVIAKKAFDPNELPNKRIAVPGSDTTAYLLLGILFDPPKNPIFCTYDEIVGLLETDRVDCGLIIHETRFTFADSGFIEIVDLGELWERNYNLPLPLGGFAAKRSLGMSCHENITVTLQKSLEYAWKHRNDTHGYVLMKSQEQCLNVVNQHIDTYVNQETLQLSQKGREAIDTLFECARGKKLLPLTDKSWQ